MAEERKFGEKGKENVREGERNIGRETEGEGNLQGGRGEMGGQQGGQPKGLERGEGGSRDITTQKSTDPTKKREDVNR